jgi:hypothetical protein
LNEYGSFQPGWPSCLTIVYEAGRSMRQ